MLLLSVAWLQSKDEYVGSVASRYRGTFVQTGASGDGVGQSNSDFQRKMMPLDHLIGDLDTVTGKPMLHSLCVLLSKCP